MYKNLKSKLVIVIVIFIIIIIIINVIGLYKVSGDSMAPTLQTTDYILICKICNYSENDIVVFTNPKNETSIKRVIGVSGDMVEIKNKKVYRNGVDIEILADGEDVTYNLNNELL
ncbi:MAG: signal peptidase I [Mycoplasmatales bacterium]